MNRLHATTTRSIGRGPAHQPAVVAREGSKCWECCPPRRAWDRGVGRGFETSTSRYGANREAW